MLKNLKNAWDIFKTKRTLIIMLILAIYYFIIQYIYYNTNFLNKISHISLTTIRPIDLISKFFNNLELYTILIILIFFITIWIYHLITYLISNTQNKHKTKLDFKKSLNISFNYSLIVFFTAIILTIIYLYLLTYISTITIILSVFIIIIQILLILLFSLGIIRQGLLNTNNIKKSLKDAWDILIKKFWPLIGYLILIIIELFIIFQIIDYIFVIFFFSYTTLAEILLALLTIIFTTYTINALAIFIKQKLN